LRTSTPSVKEIAYELGYSWQHDLTWGYHKYGGASPSELKMRAKAGGEEQF
jgi:transcriptional regulator GlxA family with amidase domain